MGKSLKTTFITSAFCIENENPVVRYLVFSTDITNTTMKSKGVVDVFFIQIIFKGTEAFSVKFTCCSGQRFPTAGTQERKLKNI